MTPSSTKKTQICTDTDKRTHTTLSNPQDQLMNIVELAIAAIRIDGNTQSRVEMDQDLVSEYSKAMFEGSIFPPVDVCFDGKEYWLVDGFHRVIASQQLGLETIRADIYAGSQRDAQLISFGVNANHGKRRTNADKRKAVMTMLADAEWCQWSDREIARTCSVHNDTVSRLRKESYLSESDRCEIPAERKVIRNGGTYTLDISNIGKKSNPVKDALWAGEITPEQADAIADKPKSIQDKLVEQARQEKLENDEYVPPENDFDVEAEAAQFEVEHEIRMAQLALLVEADDKVADAVRQFTELSQAMVEKDWELAALHQRLSFLTGELNFYKQQIKRYRAVAIKLNKQASARYS